MSQSKPRTRSKKPEKKRVNGLPWSDYNGDSGRYTGEVNDQYLPHGQGEMAYDRGLVSSGIWYNGVLDTEGPVAATVAEEKYEPDRISSYSVGDVGKARDMIIDSKKATVIAVSQIRSNDAAFVRRSDGTWTYAIVKDRTEGEKATIRFKVNARGSTKAFPVTQWGAYVRRIKRRVDAPAKQHQLLNLESLNPGKVGISSSRSVSGTSYGASDDHSVSSIRSAPMVGRTLDDSSQNLTQGKMKARRSRSRSRNRKNVTTLPLLFSSSMSVSEETEGNFDDGWETASGSGYRLRGIDP